MPLVYKVFLEKRAERDIKKLSTEIIASFQNSKPCQRTPNLQVAVKSQEPKVTGASELETIASFMKLMNMKRP
jgi:hypothetical protein